MMPVKLFVGMLVYILVMSNEASFMLSVYGMSINSCIRWMVFLTLYM